MSMMPLAAESNALWTASVESTQTSPDAPPHQSGDTHSCGPLSDLSATVSLPS